MIDIKAIREAAEKAQKFHFNRKRFDDFTRQADPATVLALCDELERLQDLLGKANALCRIRLERIKELEDKT